jgi:hypothetical protein
MVSFFKIDITNKYDVARNAVEKRILGYRDSISTSDAWKPQFKVFETVNTRYT